MTTLTKTKATRDANDRARKAELALFEANEKISALEQENKDLRFFNSMNEQEAKNILVDAVQALRYYADTRNYKQRPFASLPIFEPFSLLAFEDCESVKLSDETPSAMYAGKRAREFFKKMERKI